MSSRQVTAAPSPPASVTGQRPWMEAMRVACLRQRHLALDSRVDRRVLALCRAQQA